MIYDYTGTLLYSAKNLHKKKNGRLSYYVATYCDGENLIVKKVNTPPREMMIPAKHFNDRGKWYIHNLDLLVEKFNISILHSEKESKGADNET